MVAWEVSVTDPRFGAVLDGDTDLTDDAPAFQRALSSGAAVVRVPGGAWVRLASGIFIPPGVSLLSDAFTPDGFNRCTQLLFDPDVPVCVQVGDDSGAYGSGRLSGFWVKRAAGTIPPDSVGVLVGQTKNNSNTSGGALLDHVLSSRHSIGYRFFNGIDCNCDNIRSMEVTQDHVQIQNFAELRLSNSRFGGPTDIPASSYIRLIGGEPAGQSGVGSINTIDAVNCQFNQGITQSMEAFVAMNWAEFVGGPQKGMGGYFTQFKFTNCHIECVKQSGAMIYSDSNSWNLRKLWMTDCSYNTNAPLFILPQGCQIDDLVLVNFNHDADGHNTAGVVWSVLGPSQIKNLRALGCNFSGLALVGAPGSRAALVGCLFDALSLGGGPWSALSIRGGSTRQLNNYATGNVQVDVLQG